MIRHLSFCVQLVTVTIFYGFMGVAVALAAPEPESKQEPKHELTLENVPPDASPETYDYHVLRNNSQIGFYSFRASESEANAEAEGRAAQSLTEIKTQMGIKVKLLFITAYEAEYSATSAYNGANLIRHESTADYNGKNYLVNYDKGENPDHLVVNANGKKIPHAPMTLHPFIMDDGENLTFITEKGKLREIAYTVLGSDTIKMNTRAYETTHARITGDITRDLWYDAAGVLLKVAYEKDGATIELVRKELNKQ